jgi:hypothetical protein
LHFFRDIVFFKGPFKPLQGRKPPTFFVLFWKKKIPSFPQPPLDQGFKRGMYRSGFVRLSASRPMADSGATGGWENGEGRFFSKTQTCLLLPHSFSSFPSVQWLRENPQMTHTSKTFQCLAFSWSVQTPSVEPLYLLSLFLAVLKYVY